MALPFLTRFKQLVQLLRCPAFQSGPQSVVSPPLPPHDFVQPVLTGGGTIAEPASDKIKNTDIGTFRPFQEQARWDHAVNNQMGIIGSDFRGPEEIGSAAFERASRLLPDWINFWYPQKQPRDHRRIVYFKRTLSGTLLRSSVTKVSTFEEQFYTDDDLCIHIKPGPGYEYLVNDAHPREYTDVMEAQWTGSGHQSGKPNCDDPESLEEAESVECEIDASSQAKERLHGIFAGSVGRQLCAYGPWIYDKGHCCHPEVHPAEQIWWSDPFGEGRVYFGNLFCDESGRFWWRDQMDDGTKLKPWAEPPISGTFAIAFEMELNSPAKQFEIGVQDAHNHTTAAEGFERHHLVYQNNTLISVVQDLSNPMIVSFEDVGLVGASTVRGFLVLAASVGRCTLRPGSGLPEGTQPSQVPEHIEHTAFDKEGGRLIFTVARGIYRMF
jgi:hypothetical protein